MAVELKPAAHPDGTTIEVLDLFFNTPARRKFLRTEKTEFNHIDEVVRRIALAHFDVSFTLIHNAKVIRQYRAANTPAQCNKRVAMVCGHKFIENAIEVDCPHDSLKLSGWLAKPSFSRNQNDLCYSYVNGRMMRDKLINHAIRQAYADLLPDETYPAFVLFLQLDYREVDVNVHPAKHEVRFHQSRYVHDFIYSVCHKALISEFQPRLANETVETENRETNFLDEHQPMTTSELSSEDVSYQQQAYIRPLQQVNDASRGEREYARSTGSLNALSNTAIQNYQKLITPLNPALASMTKSSVARKAQSDDVVSYQKQANYNVDDKCFFY